MDPMTTHDDDFHRRMTRLIPLEINARTATIRDEYISEKTDERTRAVLDEQLWSYATRSDKDALVKERGGRRDIRTPWIRHCVQQHYRAHHPWPELRSVLLGLAPEVADQFWARLGVTANAGMLIKLWWDAKRVHKNGSQLSLAEAVRLVIAAWEARPTRGTTVDGFPVHADTGRVRRVPGPLDALLREGDGQAPEEPKPTNEVTRRTAYSDIRDYIGRRVTETLLAGVDLNAATDAMKRVELECNIFLDTLQRVVMAAHKQMAGQHQLNENALRTRYMAACHVLGVPPAPPRTTVDLRAAKKRHKIAASAYHPDTHGGDASVLPRFHAVQQAWEDIQAYAQVMNATATPTPKTSVVKKHTRKRARKQGD